MNKYNFYSLYKNNPNIQVPINWDKTVNLIKVKCSNNSQFSSSSDEEYT